MTKAAAFIQCLRGERKNCQWQWRSVAAHSSCRSPPARSNGKRVGERGAARQCVATCDYALICPAPLGFSPIGSTNPAAASCIRRPAIAAFSYFSLSICSSSCIALFEQRFLFGRVGRRLRGADPQQRKLRRLQPLAVFRRWLPLAVALAGVFQNRMLGRQALLRVVKLRGLGRRRK